jgi:hypothetical protein
VYSSRCPSSIRHTGAWAAAATASLSIETPRRGGECEASLGEKERRKERKKEGAIANEIGRTSTVDVLSLSIHSSVFFLLLLLLLSLTEAPVFISIHHYKNRFSIGKGRGRRKKKPRAWTSSQFPLLLAPTLN